MTFFANNAAGVELAEVICDAMACADRLHVSTGGKADMYAMRLARAYTGRGKILKLKAGITACREALMSRTIAPAEFPQTAGPAGIPESVEDGVSLPLQ